MQIQAAVLRTLNQPLSIETLSLRSPGIGEVLVKMKASGLCHTDLSVMEGKFPLPLPIIPGHEGAGVVLELGPGVTRVKQGDHVVLNNIPECGVCPYCKSSRTNFCQELNINRQRPSPFTDRSGAPIGRMGQGATFATHSLLSEAYLTRIPDDVPFTSACLTGCGVMTGVGAVMFNAKVEVGQTVLVFGLGSIGLNTVQGARLAGASRIVAIDTNPAKEALARTFGATDFVNPRTLEIPLTQHIQALLGKLADYSFECVGHPDLLRTALGLVDPFWGICVAVGIPAYTEEFKLPATSFYVGRTLRGTFQGDGKGCTDLSKLIEWYRQGQLHLDELVTHRIGLEDVNYGFDLMRQGASIRTVIEY